jgi:hypothetical protein
MLNGINAACVANTFSLSLIDHRMVLMTTTTHTDTNVMT